MHNEVLSGSEMDKEKTEKKQAKAPENESESAAEKDLSPESRQFYTTAVQILLDSKIPFLVGGAYAFQRYTNIVRHTKDFDIFVKPEDTQKVLDLFESKGYRTEVKFPHWLAKIYCNDCFVDVIYNSGNGVTNVDDEWFEYAPEDTVLGFKVKLVPPEEMLWSKALIMERERYDGADVAHMLQSHCQKLDWERLLRRFGPNWRVLLSHLVMFGFIYPGKRDQLPAGIMKELLGRLEEEGVKAARNGQANLCMGTLISREQYLVDVNEWGMKDGRLTNTSSMTKKDIKHWTTAIDENE